MLLVHPQQSFRTPTLFVPSKRLNELTKDFKSEDENGKESEHSIESPRIGAQAVQLKLKFEETVHADQNS